MEFINNINEGKTSDYIRDYLSNFEQLACGVAAIKNDDFSTLIEANNTFYEVIGYTKEQLLKKHKNHMNDILIDNFIDNILKQETNKDYDLKWDIRIKKADGSIAFVHDVCHYNAKIDTFFVMFIDITDKMIKASRPLSYETFQIRNEVLGYLNIFTSEQIIITDKLTDEVVYMNPSASKTYGYVSEEDWINKSYFDVILGFNSVKPTYNKEYMEEDFTVKEFYNEKHKMYVREKSKIIYVSSLKKEMRCNIISNITAQMRLAQQNAMQETLQKCIDSMFVANKAYKTTKDAYYDILKQLKTYYHADGSFLYKFKANTYDVEDYCEVLADGIVVPKFNLPYTMSKEQVELIATLSKLSLNKTDTNFFPLDYKKWANKLNFSSKVKDFISVVVKNKQSKILAFLVVTNPRYSEGDIKLMESLSSFIAMFIEEEQKELHREKELQLEANSKASIIQQCVTNFREFTHHEKHISNVLECLCDHYEADFAVTLTMNKENNEYGISHIGGSLIPNLDDLMPQPANTMKKFHEIFKKNNHFITDEDLDSPNALKMLKEKFGIYNFIASPIQNQFGELTGLLYVMNYKNHNRQKLLTHIVANNICDYLDKINMYIERHLEPLTKLIDKVQTKNKITEYLDNKIVGSLFIVDIDNFKALNDTLGHQIGDNAIIDIASSLKNTFRTTDVIGRIGGDEFMIFCPDLIDDELIKIKANKIKNNCNLKFGKDGILLQISASIGICKVTQDCNTFESLYVNADKALYKSKHNGKDQYYIYQPESKVI